MTQCKLWAIDRSVFKTILTRTGMQKHAHHVEFLRRFDQYYCVPPLLSTLTLQLHEQFIHFHTCFAFFAVAFHWQNPWTDLQYTLLHNESTIPLLVERKLQQHFRNWGAYSWTIYGSGLTRWGLASTRVHRALPPQIMYFNYCRVTSGFKGAVGAVAPKRLTIFCFAKQTDFGTNWPTPRIVIM